VVRRFSDFLSMLFPATVRTGFTADFLTLYMLEECRDIIPTQLLVMGICIFETSKYLLKYEVNIQLNQVFTLNIDSELLPKIKQKGLKINGLATMTNAKLRFVVKIA